MKQKKPVSIAVASGAMPPGKGVAGYCAGCFGRTGNGTQSTPYPELMPDLPHQKSYACERSGVGWRHWLACNAAPSAKSLTC